MVYGVDLWREFVGQWWKLIGWMERVLPMMPVEELVNSTLKSEHEILLGAERGEKYPAVMMMGEWKWKMTEDDHSYKKVNGLDSSTS